MRRALYPKARYPQGHIAIANSLNNLSMALEALGQAVDPGTRARLLREIGDYKFTEFAEMPMFWLYAEAVVNPKYVAEYVFPGVITGFFTHLEYVKLTQ